MTSVSTRGMLTTSNITVAIDYEQGDSLIADNVTAAMLVERTIAKTSLGNLTLLLCKI